MKTLIMILVPQKLMNQEFLLNSYDLVRQNNENIVKIKCPQF